LAPVPVAGNRIWTALVAGRAHTCGVDSAGDAYCWGRNDEGQLGIGPSRTNEYVPVPVSGGLGADVHPIQKGPYPRPPPVTRGTERPPREERLVGVT